MADAPVSPASPLMQAWEAYKATDEYANTAYWAQESRHTQGSLWAAFEQGWRAALREKDEEIARLRGRVERYDRLASEAGDTIGGALDEWERAEAAEQRIRGLEAALALTTEALNAATEALSSEGNYYPNTLRKITVAKAALGDIQAAAGRFSGDFPAARKGAAMREERVNGETREQQVLIDRYRQAAIKEDDQLQAAEQRIRELEAALREAYEDAARVCGAIATKHLSSGRYVSIVADHSVRAGGQVDGAEECAAAIRARARPQGGSDA